MLCERKPKYIKVFTDEQAPSAAGDYSPENDLYLILISNGRCALNETEVLQSCKMFIQKVSE